jgi:hypothetical protein
MYADKLDQGSYRWVSCVLQTPTDLPTDTPTDTPTGTPTSGKALDVYKQHCSAR